KQDLLRTLSVCGSYAGKSGVMQCYPGSASSLRISEPAGTHVGVNQARGWARSLLSDLLIRPLADSGRVWRRAWRPTQFVGTQ
ncbi:MAG: hypothetical protein ACK53Y_19915, partial [bacterium]